MNDITEIEGQILPPDAGSDIENPELAYQYEDLEMGSGQGIYPDVIDCHNTECQNQYEDPRTVNCCTVFGLDHTRRNSTLSNISYALFGKDISLDLAIPAFPSIEHSGWSMTGALQLFKNNGLIHGYAII